MKRASFGSSRLILAVVVLLITSPGDSGAAEKPRRFVAPDESGRLVYEQDERGNQVPDFSRSGYMGGDIAIPDVPVRVVVGRERGDAGPKIQAAIDHVSSLPADGRGIRGAVLLLAGRYEIAGSLRIRTGGVVLRGQGDGSDGTVIVASGTDRRTLIRMGGKNDRAVSKSSHAIADDYVPVGARRLRLAGVGGLHIGDAILVEHPGTAAWISELGMDRFAPGEKGSYLNWQPGTMDVRFDRVITAIEGETLTLDAPLTTALDASVGGGKVSAYVWPGRISQIGVEDIRCESEFDRGRPHDEQHSWVAISLNDAQNSWVRRVTAVHFAGSAVSVLEGCMRLTVQDCNSLQPISENGGYRRHTYYTAGQMTLFQRCRSEHGRHDFAVGYLAAGPNVFTDCEATAALGFSGPIESWASGVLYDNVTIDGGGLLLTNREIDGQGVGWAAANSVLWQCTAPVITCRKPPGAENWAIGCWGQFIGDGHWRSPNEFIKPVSLYQAQLAERLGGPVIENLSRRERMVPSGPDDAPTIDALVPQLASETSPEAELPSKRLTVRDGWIVCDGKLMVGGRIGTTWWRGNLLPSRAPEFGVGLTRFVPGRDGPGYTDDLEQLTDSMRDGGRAVLEHHWGLWFDRRRDDHEMIRRIDGDVWPPFYEQPWARSGQGVAWDGLSRYDLTAFNPWYFGRLSQFAAVCDRKGLALFHQAYFQHNILEAGAHWADFPWRPANCLQETGFPEPPPYAGKKRVFMADDFYDVTHPERRRLHQLYIRKCLDTLSAHSNVIYLTGDEYTGPLKFVQFWIDTVVEWERETGRKVMIGLSCTKDVQDAILADPARGPEVSVIELKYWWYMSDGSLYAPEGGQNLAPRQQLREWRGKKGRSSEQTARQVREYRSRYPDKAIVCADDPADGWAVLAAGGSIPRLANLDGRLRAAVPRMKPFEPPGLTERQWALAEPDRNYLVYSSEGDPIRLDLSATRETFKARRFNPNDGEAVGAEEVVQGGGILEFRASASKPTVLWLSRDRP